MMKKRTFGGIMLLLLLGITTLTAQPTTLRSDGALLQRFAFPTFTPPLTSDMPYDVMIGYIIGDSVARGLYLAKQDSIFRSLTPADTLNYGLKYLYEMIDFDPIRFFLWGSYRPMSTTYLSPPSVLRTRLIERAKKALPDSMRTAVLCTSDIIAHIKVNETQGKIDTMAAYAKHAVLVTSTIVDPIKGQRIPNCWIDSRTKGDKGRSVASAIANAEGSRPAAPGACLQFEYRLEWTRLNHSMARTSLDSTLVDRDGKQWIQPGGEYIVLLELVALGRDNAHSYAVLSPEAWFGTVCSMYPVIDGKVYDPYNDFGFGANLTVEQFKDALRIKTHSITHP
jgi:hypothetical protein